MARVKLNEPLDMTLGDGTFWPWIFHAEITSHDNTTLTYSLSSPGGLRSMTLMGKGFTYSPGGEITGGAVHQVIWMDGAEQAASITNANVDMVRLMTDVAMEDWRAVASDFFSGKDVIKGSSGNDMLSGFDGPDTISAGLGADTLLGGTGPDILSGGRGADIFRFEANDSTGKNPDLITDLSSKDSMLIRGLDVLFQHTESYDKESGLTTFTIDSNADGKTDLVITATGDHTDFHNFIAG